MVTTLGACPPGACSRRSSTSSCRGSARPAGFRGIPCAPTASRRCPYWRERPACGVAIRCPARRPVAPSASPEWVGRGRRCRTGSRCRASSRPSRTSGAASSPRLLLMSWPLSSRDRGRDRCWFRCRWLPGGVPTGVSTRRNSSPATSRCDGLCRWMTRSRGTMVPISAEPTGRHASRRSGDPCICGPRRRCTRSWWMTSSPRAQRSPRPPGRSVPVGAHASAPWHLRV